MTARFISVLVLSAALFFNARAVYANYSDWHVIGKDRQANISGMAMIEQTERRTSFIVVHDNKKKKQSRAGIVVIEGEKTSKFTTLDWLGNDVPDDLEAVTKIPEVTNGFMAFTSAGKVYQLELDQKNNSLQVIKSFTVPSIPENGNFEGFSLQRVGNVDLAVWAERGENARPATLFWSNFDLQTNAFTKVSSVSIKVPYPTANVRHISDVKVDPTGKVYISSAADPGDDGPFTSAIYLAGTFEFTNPSTLTFTSPASLNQLFAVGNRKIEAFELLSEASGMVYGTDDENLGSAVYLSKPKK